MTKSKRKKYLDGYQMWWLNKLLHRLDGPAVIGPGDHRSWYVNGNHITNEYDLSLFDSEEGQMVLIIKYGEPDKTYDTFR